MLKTPTNIIFCFVGIRLFHAKDNGRIVTWKHAFSAEFTFFETWKRYALKMSVTKSAEN